MLEIRPKSYKEAAPGDIYSSDIKKIVRLKRLNYSSAIVPSLGIKSGNATFAYFLTNFEAMVEDCSRNIYNYNNFATFYTIPISYYNNPTKKAVKTIINKRNG
jgi:hypothetical protein